MSRYGTLRAWLVALGAYHLALGAWMLLAPGTFFDAIGPFGDRNDHYTRDVSTFYLALGVVLLLSANRRRWRVPVLAFAAIEYLIHTINHLVDIGDSHPSAWGTIDFVLLALATVLLGWLLRRAALEGRPRSTSGPGGRPGA